MKSLLLTTVLAAAALLPAHAAVVITEASPTGSSNGNYNADWFELTNNGATAVDLTGWRVDDNSNSFAVALVLRGITSIAPGASVVFIETTATGTTDATVTAAFTTAWFGGNVPAGFTIGTYGGAGIGLSNGGDAVNIFNAGGTLQANIVFGAASTGISFDNAAGLNNATVSTLSQSGVRGAFTNSIGEVGSPGAVPEPGTCALLGAGALALLATARRRFLRSSR